ncbi:MAG TPA: DUF3105 domain-containing protein [Actinomycetota bacterium]
MNGRPLTPATVLLALAIAATLAMGTVRALTFEPVPITGAPTPEGALRAYYEALEEEDCRAAARYVDPAFLTAEQLCERFEETVAASGSLVGVTDREVGEETATLIAERVLGDHTDHRVVRVARAGDLWRLAGGSSCFPVLHPTDLGTAHLEEDQAFDDYSSIPPTSGPHSPVPTTAGAVYQEPQPLPEVVHAMEHGAVVVWVSPEAPEPMRERLLRTVSSTAEEGYASLIVTPLPGLEEPFAMTAWGSLQRCLGVSPPEIHAFVEAHYASGGEGALACAGPAAEVPRCRDA